MDFFRLGFNLKVSFDGEFCRVNQNLKVLQSGGSQPSLSEQLPPPQHMEAEQALIGALLVQNERVEDVGDFLKGEHFATAVHGRIYDSIRRCVDRGQVADPITLKTLFEKDSDLEEVGGASYLADLAESVFSFVNLYDYGQIIYDAYLRRQLMAVGHDLVVKARTLSSDEKATHHLEATEKKLFDLATLGVTKQRGVAFSEALTKAIESAQQAHGRDSHVVGVTTGLTDMDRMLGGLHPSDLVILAGRPSMGKTALATNLAFNAAKIFHQSQKDGAPVAFFSLEMSSEQLALRILASESKIPSDRIRRGAVSAGDFPKFAEVVQEIGSLPLIIDDTPGLNVAALRNRARRLKRQHNIGFIVIDYLQLLEMDRRSGGDNRVQEISEITRSLKAIARELHVPVLALSQLSRAVEQRDDKRPQLSDLRESGSIEQDADVVMFVYREEYYEARREPPPDTDKHREWQQRMGQIYNQAEVIIAKQRHGPIGTVKLFFDSPLTTFGNLAS